MNHASHAHHDEPHGDRSGPDTHGRHETLAMSNHDRHAGHSVAMFRNRFWMSLVVTIPILASGHMLRSLTGLHPPELPGSSWLLPLLGTPLYFYGGWPFLQGAVRELKQRVPGMMVLISLGITVAFAFSVVVTLGYPGSPLWEELATLITVMLLGHWIEMRSVSRAYGALQALAKLLPNTAVREVDGRPEEVPLSALRKGDLLLVRPGSSIPADGVVQSGHSSVNESLITGESRPIEKTDGAAVTAGTVNSSGSLRIVVTRTGQDTSLARIMRLVEQAQSSRSRAQALADRAAFFLTVIAIGAALLTAIAWTLVGGTGSFIVQRVVSVLVVACPHALGLAIPLVIAISTTLAARSGLLVRDRRGLEEARKLNVVVFDKTGTLTLGAQRVVAMRAAGGLSDDAALELAAAVERDSEHPIARAITATADERGIDPPKVEGFRALPGQGAEARIDGRVVQVGGPNLLRARKVTPPADLNEFARTASSRGQATIYLLEGERVVAVFAIADAIRPESGEAVQQLHERKVLVAMLTGDARSVADAVARELGIDTVFAEVLPENKAKKIQELKASGKRVAMVGDGVNDAPALVTSDVGIAIGAGTEVAVEAGDIVLVRSDPRDVPRIIELSRASYRKMVQNLWWAAGYNIIAIPLAGGVLFPRWGILLPPAAAALIMSISTVIVAINAELLRRHRL
jgi:Cu2+-exporting ATPase